MSDRSLKTPARDPSSVIPPVLGAAMAFRLGLLLLVGVALIATFAVIDRSRVGTLEQFAEVTAVGDTVYFEVPSQTQKPPAAAATFQGQPLYPVSYSKVKVKDPEMLRLGRDVGTGLTIYRSSKAIKGQPGEMERNGEAFYFLKIAPGEYIKVRPFTPGK